MQLDLDLLTFPTLEAVDKAIEEKFAADNQRRTYLGASTIGEPCKRKLWYYFRWLSQQEFEADTIRKFEDGHTQEAVMRDRLNLVPGVTVHSDQLEIQLYGKHFSGHIDGIIEGVKEAPKTPHLWEHKSVAVDKFNKLKKLMEIGDPKESLKFWDEIYYGQAQIYMYMLDITRHFLTVSTPGGRDYISCRTNVDKPFARQLIQKAEEVIFADTPPERDESYKCNWCQYREVCKEESIEAEINCRTCIYSTPMPDGKWICEKQNNKELTKKEQIKGCKKHLFIPAIFDIEQTSAVEEKGEFVQINYAGKIINKAGKGMELCK